MLSLLFVQLASAAYGCPPTFTGDAGSMPNMQTAYADCTQIDAALPSLCAVQVSASSNVPLVHKLKAFPHAAGLWSIGLLGAPSGAFAATPSVQPPPGLFRAISPPLSIRDCRFLI
jgi:hypothetical protein